MLLNEFIGGAEDVEVGSHTSWRRKHTPSDSNRNQLEHSMGECPLLATSGLSLVLLGWFMKFDDVTVWISNKEENRPVRQLYGLGDCDSTSG